MSAPAQPVVELIHLVDEGVYLLEQLPWGTQLQVDGLPVKPPAVVADPSRLVRLVPASRRLTGYASPDGTMGVEEFNARRTLLLEKADEDDVFDNIDDEYAYKKLMATWSPMLETVPARTEPIDFKVVEIRRDSGDPDIRSLWNDSALPAQRALYQVSRLHVSHKTLVGLAAKHGLAVDVPNHSGIRFAKLDGHYAFDESVDFSKGGAFIGTLEQCKAEKARVVKLVEAPVLAAAAKKCGTSVLNAGEIRDSLASALSDVRALQLKQSSPSRHRALTLLTRAVESLDKQIAEELS